ncbi:MAG: ATP synthase F1 subunit epsilon [Alphaproteobacteria bacterium]|nr:ATP synthase F1 subunit epsilon [Alphaproteobacteria bacterium]
MSLNVDIVTPEKVVYSGRADEVRVPGVNGEFGVLPDHALLLSLVKAGVVTVMNAGKSTRYVVGRGFAEAGPDRVVLLTDSCESADGVDKAAARELLTHAEAVIVDTAPGTDARLTAERDAELARARLEA